MLVRLPEKTVKPRGNANIFTRASHIIEDMIVEILNTDSQLKAQKGKVVKFTRRKPEDET